MSVGLQRLREDADTIRDGAIRKGEDPGLIDRAIELDAERRRLLAENEALKAERNTASKRIGEAIKGGAAPDGPDVADLRAASTAAGLRITALDASLAETQADLDDLPARRAFEAIYLAFLGRPNGPRAGWLLAGLDPQFVAERAWEASGWTAEGGPP